MDEMSFRQYQPAEATKPCARAHEACRHVHPPGAHLAHVERRGSDGVGEVGSQWRADVPVQAHGLRVLDGARRRRQDEAVHDLGRRLAVGLRTADELHRCRDTSPVIRRPLSPPATGMSVEIGAQCLTIRAPHRGLGDHTRADNQCARHQRHRAGDPQAADRRAADHGPEAHLRRRRQGLLPAGGAGGRDPERGPSRAFAWPSRWH
jgi:hypothetical protein